MINRTLIRIKILQIIYAYYQKGANDLKVAENELLLSMRRSCDLYHYLLLLIVEITRMYERIASTRRNKYQPTDEDLNPDMRMYNNRLAKQLMHNEALQKYARDHGISWADDVDFIRKVLDTILNSKIYADYLRNETDSYETDKNFWRHVFKRIIASSKEFEDYLEEKSIYWNDDLDIIESFVIKTIKRFDENIDANQELLPMFSNQDDYDYAIRLFRQSLLHGSDCRERIDRHATNWETDRVATMDMIIMQVALTEIMYFPTIPISVTLNEFIEAAKYYSTPKSAVFINGVLDAVIADLKNEQKLMKV